MIRNETAHSVHGVPGRLTVAGNAGAKTWIAQKWTSEDRPISGYRKGAVMRAQIRFDDECRNGHNSFSLTAEVRVPGARDIEAGGCMHDEIAKVFPELAPLALWHLVSTDGPLHYLANTIYHAGNRDHRGLLAGEKQARAAVLPWQIPVIGEGKARELDFARSSACWPEATDAELSVKPAELRAVLEARLPALMAQFRAAIDGAGLAWEPAPEVA